MTRKQLHNTIRARFKALVADAIEGGLPTQYDNDGAFEKPDDSRWCRFTVLLGDSFQSELGSARTTRTAGVAIAQVFVPVGQGDAEALDVADGIEPHFRQVTADGVVWKTPRTKTVGRDGAWWQVNVTCPFHADAIT